MGKPSKPLDRLGEVEAAAVSEIREKTIELPPVQVGIMPKTAESAGESKPVYSLQKTSIQSDETGRAPQGLDESSDRCGGSESIEVEMESKIIERLKFARSRGFELDEQGLEQLVSRTTIGKGDICPTRVSTVVRQFYEKHPEHLSKNLARKERISLEEEIQGQVQSFAKALRDIDESFPGVYGDGKRLWSLAEAVVDMDCEEFENSFFTGGSPLHGAHSGTRENGSRRITIVIGFSASGLVTPPFCIVEGRLMMSNWLLPLDERVYEFNDETVQSFVCGEWFPEEGETVCSRSGSLDDDVVPILISHLDNFVRTVVPESEHYVLCVNNRTSRKGVEWVDLCAKRNCEVVQSPAVSLHYLQPFDQLMKTTFSKTLAKLRANSNKTEADARRIQFRLACGVFAILSIEKIEIKKSFELCGLFPMDFCFASKFLIDDLTRKIKALENERTFAKSSVVASLKRKADEEAMNDIRKILKDDRDKSHALRDVALLLRNYQVHLTDIHRSRASETSPSSSASQTRPATCHSLDGN